MKELRLDQLNDVQRAATANIRIPEGDQLADYLFLVRPDDALDAGLLIGLRTAQMFSAGEPIKWGPRAFLDGTFMPDEDEIELRTMPVPVESDQAGREKARTLDWLAATDIMRSPLNPRTHFPGEKLAELRESFSAHGFNPAISRLLVRPLEFSARPLASGWTLEVQVGGVLKPMLEWYAECTGKQAAQELREMLTEEACHAVIAKLPRHELVCGERRWTVASRMGIECPVVVQELTDLEVLELQLIENLQRDDLTPLEEAEGYGKLCAQRGADGQSLYTSALLAKRVGKSERHVNRMRRLALLKGTKAGDAIETGGLSAWHGMILASLPTAKLRDEVAKKALAGRYGNGTAMSTRELEEFIEQKYMVHLSATDFDQADAALLPVEMVAGERVAGGACSDCPFNTLVSGAGSETAEPGAKRGRAAGRVANCLNVDCYGRKRRADYERWASKWESGTVVVGFDERRSLLDFSGKKLATDSGMVGVEDKPEEWLLKEGTKNPPPWKKLIAGQGVPEKVLRADDGAVHRCVPKLLAIEAAKKNGHRIFDADSEDMKDTQQDHEREQRREAFTIELRKDPANAAMSAEEAQREFDRLERERAKQAQAEQMQKAAVERERSARLKIATTKALLEGVRRTKQLDREFWDLLMEPLAGLAASSDDLPDVLAALGIRVEGDVFEDEAGEKALDKFIAASPTEHMPALALHMAVCGLNYDRIAAWEKRAFKTFKVDFKAAQKAEWEIIDAEEAAAQEQREIDAGLRWVTRREKAADFEWDGTTALNPDVCEVAMPADVKAEVSIFASRDKNGWHAGMSVKSKRTGGVTTAIGADATDYGTRELAIVPMLQEVLEHFQRVKMPSASARIAAYIARLHTPASEPAKGAKKGKK